MKNQGPLKSSLNAGELSPDLDKKVGLKQFYSGAKRMKNLEPVPQSGMRLSPGSDWVDTARTENCRIICLRVRQGLSYILVLSPGFIDIYNAVTRVRVKTFSSAPITLPRLDQYEFYGEANTIGIWHQDDALGVYLLRDESDESVWTIGDWPYGKLPKVDLGGTYTKSSDRWEFSVRFTDDTPGLVIVATIDGETTPGVILVDSVTAARIKPDLADNLDRAAYADDLQAAMRLLPNMTNDLTVTYIVGDSTDNYWTFRVDFPGDLSGVEYDFDASVTNSADASALVNHTRHGETTFENLISNVKGGYAGATNFQDRQIYWAPRSKPSSITQSRTGEYFDLDISRVGDASARLDGLRSETSETILCVVPDGYLLVFTDRAEYFVNNRVIKQSEPLNFVFVSDIGTKKGVRPQKFDGRMWMISGDGAALHSIQYDAVSENYVPRQEDLLARHLVKNVRRMWRQRKVTGSNLPRLWIARSDGRLIYATTVADQEISAFVEWVAAQDGRVSDIMPDGNDQMWVVVKRGAMLSLEVLREEDQTIFQATLTKTTNLAGIAVGLSIFNGRQVWCRTGGYITGPFTITDGTLDTQIPGSHVSQIGLWQPPYFESMPYYQLLPNEEILERPARVHTITANVIDTESIAIGANGQTPKNIALNRASDDLSSTPLPFTGAVQVAGLKGMKPGPTVVITQTRPGRLNVRDYTPGVKF